MIRLSQIAPWNRRLRNPYRTRYTQHDGRYFKVEADRLDAPWFVWEITADGEPINDSWDDAFVARAWNLPAVRRAIELRVEGKTEKEISAALRELPSAGTGRNHPRNVAARRGG